MTRLFATAGGSMVNKIVDVHRASELSSMIAENDSRISSMPKEIDENGVVAERSTIEACASSGKPYVYNTRWGDEAKQQLVEYAAICGCKAVAIDPEDASVKASAKPTIVKEASVAAQAPKANTLDIGDVFGIGTKGDTSHLEKSKWEQLTAETKVVKPDVVTYRAGAILPIGGGETYEKSPHLHVKPGQNSVTAPDAIGELLKDKGEDIGTSLKRQKAEREAFRAAGIRASDEAAAKKMKGDKDFGAYGGKTVHLTEILTAQPGVRDGTTQSGVFQGKLKDMPDRTQGENLREQVDQRKAGITRQASAKTEFRAEGSSRHTLSDIFTQPEKWAPKQTKQTRKVDEILESLAAKPVVK